MRRNGVRRVVPIRGGRVTGPGLQGRVLNAGADFQRYPSEDVAHLSADYVLELDDGHRILVENLALRTGDPEDLRRIPRRLGIAGGERKFSAIRSREDDFGKTTSPRWTCQRSVTCAGVFPACRAISRRWGSSRGSMSV